MGFCLYSSIAVGAAYARSRGLSRVAIVDYDVHHGNGTQAAFYEDPSVLFVSSHQFPFYPGTGAASETGRGAGLGFTLNLPLDLGALDRDVLPRYEREVLPRLEAFKPELLMISAGFDAHERDPLAGCRMSTAGFRALTTMLVGAADRLLRGARRARDRGRLRPDRPRRVPAGRHRGGWHGLSLRDHFSRESTRVRLPSARARSQVAGALGRDPGVRGDRRSQQAEVLLPRDVRVPVRARARRPRPQLHHRRRGRAPEAAAGLQRAAPVRVGRLRPAGRERGHQERHPSRGRRRSATSPT